MTGILECDLSNISGEEAMDRFYKVLSFPLQGVCRLLCSYQDILYLGIPQGYEEGWGAVARLAQDWVQHAGGR